MEQLAEGGLVAGTYTVGRGHELVIPISQLKAMRDGDTITINTVVTFDIDEVSKKLAELMRHKNIRA